MRVLGLYSDNELSKQVMAATGLPVADIKEFNAHDHDSTLVVYGLLRGGSQVMGSGSDYYYIDNGYFDAKYIDSKGRKEMDGWFRVVKNDTHHVFDKEGVNIYSAINWVLLLPPSPYSAMHHMTTPEDWIRQSMQRIASIYGDVRFLIRNKGADRPLVDDISAVDAIWSFNSMAIMKALEIGKPVNDTHGIFRKDKLKVYDYNDIRDFYEPKQYKLEHLKDYPW